MKWVWVLLVLLPSVLGAVIHGTVYDFGLNKMPNSVVEIDTSPRQQMVAVGGAYSFSVPPGNYTLSARFKDSDIDENISAVSDGDYVFDLILLPNVDELSVETPEVPLVEDVVQDAPVTSWLIWLFVFAVLAFVAYRVSRPRKIVREVADDLQRILEFVEKEGGRTTQKDIRKNFPYSEAKISLMIDDLEAKGLLKRIKKGRGNIIVK